MSEINIPEGVTQLEYATFRGCTNLKSIKLSQNILKIDDDVFSGCSKLTKIEVDAKNPNYIDVEGILFDKNIEELICYPSAKENENYTIPNSVKKIRESAFYNPAKLKSITIPESVTDIDSYAFRIDIESSLENIYVPYVSQEEIPQGWENSWISGDKDVKINYKL